MLSEPTRAVKIFFSYAHADDRYRSELEKHLVILKRHGYITIWHDGRINAGEVFTHLNNADIILLLISPDFMASDYCDSVEVTSALKRHDAGECRVIPIILRPVSWKITRFSKLQVLPLGGKPISTWSNKDQAFFDIAEGLIKVIKEISIASSLKVARNLPAYPQMQPQNSSTMILSPLAKVAELTSDKSFSDICF